MRGGWVHHVVAPNAGPVALRGRARLVVMCDRGGGAKGATVHANVVFVNVDATQADPARRGLHDQVIPRVSQTPGFVAGYWLEPLDGKGISVTLWESEQAAREAAGLIHAASSPTTGVKVDRIETREVIGQA
jgi:hypothetical protein